MAASLAPAPPHDDPAGSHERARALGVWTNSPSAQPGGSQMTAIPSLTLPPVGCTTWCWKGDGHTDAKHPDDQYCFSQERVVTLSHHPLLEVGASTRIPDHVTAQLHRDAGAAIAHVSVTYNDLSAFQLSPDEARQLGSALLRLAKTAGA